MELDRSGQLEVSEAIEVDLLKVIEIDLKAIGQFLTQGSLSTSTCNFISRLVSITITITIIIIIIVITIIIIVIVIVNIIIYLSWLIWLGLKVL